MFKKNRFKKVSLHRRTKLKRPINIKKLGKIVAFLLLILLVGIVISLIKNNPFQIKQINFLTPAYCAPNSEIEALIKPQSQNFFVPNFFYLEKKIVERYPCIKTVSIKKVFPSTLEVSTTPRQKVASITTYISNLDQQFKLLEATSSSQAAQVTDLSPKVSQATASASFVVDNDNVVFSAEVDPNQPMINLFDQNITSGQILDNDLVNKSLEVIQNLQKQGLLYKTINARGSSLYVDSEPSINLSLNKDISRQLISLQLILQKAKIEGKQVQKVDLRFEKSVVIYSAKKSP